MRIEKSLTIERALASALASYKHDHFHDAVPDAVPDAERRGAVLIAVLGIRLSIVHIQN